MLRNRFSLRQKVDIPGTWIFRDEESEAKLVDLCCGGCYLNTQLAGLNEGSNGELGVMLPYNNHSYSLEAEIIWINQFGAHEKPIGFGFRFNRRNPGFMKDVTRHYGQGMLVR